MVITVAPIKILRPAVVVGMEQLMHHSMVDLLLSVKLIGADCHLQEEFSKVQYRCSVSMLQ